MGLRINVTDVAFHLFFNFFLFLDQDIWLLLMTTVAKPELVWSLETFVKYTLFYGWNILWMIINRSILLFERKEKIVLTFAELS